MTYSEQLKHPKWQKKRLSILERDQWCCQLCSDTESNLQVHHKEYISGRKPWEYEDSNFQTLCKHCHSVVEYFKSKNLIPIISSKNIVETFEDIMTIASILKSNKYGMILAINYYNIKTETISLGAILEKTPYLGISNLFDNAEKLLK